MNASIELRLDALTVPDTLYEHGRKRLDCSFKKGSFSLTALSHFRHCHIFFRLVACYATLHPTMSVGWSVGPCGGAFPPRFRRDFDARPNCHATSVSGWRWNRGFRFLFSGFSKQFSLVASDVTCHIWSGVNGTTVSFYDLIGLLLM